ncbi:MAG: DUF935 family protein, partial [Magnetococcales bacterium]|nr:DUF935 family protein [Magnetococcales bacterium]
SDGSSLSQAQVHERMLNQVVQADGNLVASSFNRSVMVWLTDWNFPGAATPRLSFVTDEPDDLDARAAREKTIYETTGLKPTRKHVETVYGGEWEESTPQPTQQPAAAEQSPPAQFAEGNLFPAQQAVDAVAFDNDELQAIAAALLKPILARMQEGVSPEELLNLLGESYPEMDYQGLTELLDRLLFAGETWGRLDANNG